MAANDEVKVYDIQKLLSGPERDFLLRNNGQKVAVSTLKGKKLGLYFSASWFPVCKSFTKNLVEAYGKLVEKGDFEVVFVSGDEAVESSNNSFSKMPWLAVPFTDSQTKRALYRYLKVYEVPCLMFLDENGKLFSDDGVGIIFDYGAEGYPFTPEWVKEIKEQKEEAMRKKSLRSILQSASCDFIIAANGSEAPITNLDGKMVGLYCMVSSSRNCSAFTATLVKVYTELKAKEENFEIVLVPLDDNEESFRKAVSGVPWFSIPFQNNKLEKVARHFNRSVPLTLVIIGPDGKILHPNVADAIVDHGANAYPFTPDKFSALEKIDKARQEAQNLESLLVSGDVDFVVGKDGEKIPVSDLVGKYILLYFSAHWCSPCFDFTPQLDKTYHKIKEKHGEFEVIFMSCDTDQASYEKYYSTMPWLTLPWGDAREQSQSRRFKVKCVPSLVALGPTGKTIITKAFELILSHGAMAFPFTDEHVAKIDGEYDEMSKNWPKQVKHELHQEHEVILSRIEAFECDGCHMEGKVWAYSCEECDFDLHPECAIEELN